MKIPQKYRRLAAALTDLGIDTQQELAQVMHTHKNAIAAKFKGVRPWTLPEMYQLMRMIGAPASEMHLYFTEDGEEARETRMKTQEAQCPFFEKMLGMLGKEAGS